MTLLLALLTLLACEGRDKAPPVTLEDGCKTLDFGYDDPSDDAREGLERTNCYRGLLGLGAAELQPALDIASQSHAEYMATNGLLTHQQDSRDEGYTGEWVWDRAERAGYDWPANTLMSEVVSVGYGPSGAVDGWVNSVYHRIPFVTPDIREVGFGQQDRYSSMAFVSDFTTDAPQAVIYPVDGQIDVPLRFNSDEEYPDPAPDQGYVGPPITVTVSASGAPGSDTNPYVLVLREASLVGPDGALDFIELTPDNDASMFNTIALVPTEPLQPETEYEVEIQVTWNDGEETLFAAFQTVAE